MKQLVSTGIGRRRFSFLLVGVAALQAAPALAVQEIDVFEASVAELQDALSSGRVTSVRLVEAYLARIAAYDSAGPRLNAILRLNPAARAEAEALDRERLANGPRGPLHGIPILLKDNFDVQGMPTTAGSVALANNVPVDDAFQVRRLKEAGVVILGKTNLHELASGITTISSIGGQTLNPYDPLRNPGGSSGGTGAAIAASFAALGWGTDTCGSIRIPASHNNLFGLRPSKGLSSIDGIVPLSHSQDVAGPLARSVRDLALGLDATAGYDPADTATRAMAQRPEPRFVASLDSGALRGARIGLLTQLFADEGTDQENSEIVRAAIARMKDAGAEIFDVDMPGLDSLISGAGVIDHEFKFDLADYLSTAPSAQVRSVDDILRTGLYHASLESRLNRRNRAQSRDALEYRTALGRRERLSAVVRDALASYRADAFVYPTMRVKPALIDEVQAGSTCALSAQTGLPALSAPAGFTADGLPVGLELLGASFADERLVSLAYAYELAARPRRPPPFSPALVGGRAPAPMTFSASSGTGGGRAAVGAQTTAEFSYDPVRAALSWDVTVTGIEAERVNAIVLLRAAPGTQVGPVVWRLGGPAQVHAKGEIRLSFTDREALLDGHIVLATLTRDDPAAASRVVLVPRR